MESNATMLTPKPCLFSDEKSRLGTGGTVVPEGENYFSTDTGTSTSSVTSFTLTRLSASPLGSTAKVLKLIQHTPNSYVDFPLSTNKKKKHHRPIGSTTICTASMSEKKDVNDNNGNKNDDNDYETEDELELNSDTDIDKMRENLNQFVHCINKRINKVTELQKAKEGLIMELEKITKDINSEKRDVARLLNKGAEEKSTKKMRLS